MALHVGPLQGQANSCHVRGGLAVHGELEVVALAHSAQLLDIAVVGGDQGAHFATGHAQVRSDRVECCLGIIEVGALGGNVLVQRAHLLLVCLLGQFCLKLFGLFALIVLKLRYHGAGVLQLPARGAQSLRGPIQFILQRIHLLCIRVFDRAQAASELILELRAQLFAVLGLLRFQRVAHRVGFVDRVNLT